MSSRQSGNKSKNDKAGGGGKNNAAANPSLANQLGHDFLPGRLNLADWFQLTKDEDELLFLGEIVDDVIDHVLDKCEVNYLEKQLVPYTIMQTKNTLLQLIQWHFLAHDQGEKDISDNKDWCEEEEPEPSKIDSWAQGSVPVIVTPAPKKETVHRMHKKNKLKEGERNSEEAAPLPEESKVLTIEKSKTVKKHKKPQVQMKYDQKDQTESRKSTANNNTHKRSNVSKNQTRSSPSNRTAQTRENPVGGGKGTKQKRAQQNSDVIYDEDGYIVGLPRVSMEGMPQYQFAMQYKVVSNNQPLTKTNKTLGNVYYNGQRSSKATKLLNNRLKNTMRNSAESSKRRKSFLMRHVTEMYSTMKHPGAIIDVQMSTSTVDTQQTIQHHAHEQELYPHVPSLIETIEVEPGVEVVEGVVSKKGASDELGQGNNRRRRLAHNVRDPNQLTLLGNSDVRRLMSDVTTSQYSVLPSIQQQSEAV